MRTFWPQRKLAQENTGPPPPGWILTPGTQCLAPRSALWLFGAQGFSARNRANQSPRLPSEAAEYCFDLSFASSAKRQSLAIDSLQMGECSCARHGRISQKCNGSDGRPIFPVATLADREGDSPTPPLRRISGGSARLPARTRRHPAGEREKEEKAVRQDA